MAPAMGQCVLELQALEETHTELRVLEEDYAKEVLRRKKRVPPQVRVTVRTWTTYSSESALWNVGAEAQLTTTTTQTPMTTVDTTPF